MALAGFDECVHHMEPIALAFILCLVPFFLDSCFNYLHDILCIYSLCKMDSLN